MMNELINLPGAVPCKFKKGDIIIHQDEQLKYVYYLSEGLIYRTILNEKGDETIYDTKSGDNQLKSTLGILYLFNDGKSHTNFIAKTNCECYRIPRESIMNYILDKPKLLRELVDLAMEFYNITIIQLQQRQQKTVVNQLCQFLLEQANVVDGKLAVRKACTNAEISRFLGVHHVTASRIIKCLKDEGVIIRCANGLTILDKQQLQSYAYGESKMKYS